MPKVTPKVVYLDQLLQELQTGTLRIPSFQRPFEWSPDQILKLLESVVNQYPIGSLLIWQTDKAYRSLENIGPHKVEAGSARPFGGMSFLLDGHQRMSTLAGTLLPLPASTTEPQSRKWSIWYDLKDQKMKRKTTEDRRNEKSSPKDFVWWVPVSSLLDSLAVHNRTSELANVLGSGSPETADLVKRLRTVSGIFQRYAIPVNVIEDASLEEAVKVFALLNTTGKRVSADRVFTALTYQNQSRDIAAIYDEWFSDNGILGMRGFQNLQRVVLYRATLASLGRPIYEDPWEAYKAGEETVQGDGAGTEARMMRLGQALEQALDFLAKELFIRHPSVLPYGLQIIQLTEFYRVLGPGIEPSESQRQALVRSLWGAALSSSYNLGGSRRLDDAIERTRQLARGDLPVLPGEKEPAWPLPSRFNPRSARVRAFFLFLASRAVHPKTGMSWDDALKKGLKDSYPLFKRQERFDAECLENRILCPTDARSNVVELLVGLKQKPPELRQKVLYGLVIPEEAMPFLELGKQKQFWDARRKYMIEQENLHIQSLGLVIPREDEDPDIADENDADGEEEPEDIF